MNDLESFNAKLKAFAEKAKKAPIVATKIAALEILKQTILNSNIDTGRMIGGWQISTGSSPKFDDGSFISFAEITSPDSFKQERIDKNLKKLDKIEKPASGKLWFANNVEYVKYQEFGTDHYDGNFAFTRAVQNIGTKLENLVKDQL